MFTWLVKELCIRKSITKCPDCDYFSMQSKSEIIRQLDVDVAIEFDSFDESYFRTRSNCIFKYFFLRY